MKLNFGDTHTRLVFALTGIACAAIVPLWMNFDIISMDGAFQYIPSAELFLDGRFKEALMRPQLPLYPMLMALVAWITGLDLELAGRALSVLCFVLSAPAMFLLARLVTGSTNAAIVSVVFLISNPQLLVSSVDCLKESLFICLILWGNYLVMKWAESGDSRKKAFFLVGSVLIVLACAVRTIAVFFIVTWLLLWVFHKKQGFLFRLLLLLLPVVLAVSMVVIFSGSPFFERKGFAIFTLLSVLPGPRGILEGIPLAIMLFLKIGGPLVMCFAFAGFFLSEKTRYLQHALIVLGLFFILFVMMGRWTSDRYVLSPVIWLYPLAANAVVLSWGSSHKIAKFAAVLAVASGILAWLHAASIPPDPARVARKHAGQWILDQLGPGQRVYTNRPRIGYYARAIPVDLGKYSKHDPAAAACIALDIKTDQGERMLQQLNDRGRKPDMKFDGVHVYIEQRP